MLFSYNWLKEYVKLPKPEKLAELLTMHSFEVEELSSQGKDFVLDIDVLPDRGPDCFSHIGIARECAALFNLKLKTPACRQAGQNLQTSNFISVEVKNKEDCFRYTARVIADVKIKQSPKWLQERLRVCGLRPINNIVDIANYVMLEIGQPLHAFDLDKIEGAKLLVRRARRGEKIITLDNEKYDLDKDILIIADSKSPLAVAGIKGGKKAEVDKKTKTIVLESANFNLRVVRKASRKLGLKTDASCRFEHGLDPNLTEIAINRAAKLIGGRVSQGLVDFYPKKVQPQKIKLDLNYIERLLGIKILLKEVKKILEQLGFKVGRGPTSAKALAEVGPQQILVEVPTFRLDISLPEDLIEEIGRLYGYEKIPVKFPVGSLIPSEKNFNIFWENKTKDILKEVGFSEVYNYSFISDKERKLFGYKEKEVLELENPISKDYKYLRPSLIPNLLKNLAENLRFFNKIEIFELGKIFNKGEKRMLTGLSTQGFYQAKGIVDSLLNKLGISDIWYDDYQQTPEESKQIIWEPEKSAEIKVGDQEIGFLGELTETRPLLSNRGRVSVVLFDIDFEKLSKLCSEECEYQPISQYPSAVRDIAVLVPLGVKVADVLNKINIAGGGLVRDVDLFDIYEGEELPQGKKNLAFHIIYQAEDRTLKTKEIDVLQQKIIKALEKDPEWEVRK